MNETIAAIRKRDKIAVYCNRVASEPRYEAWSQQKYCAFSDFFDGSEEDAILGCAAAVRKGIEYPNRGDNLK